MSLNCALLVERAFLFGHGIIYDMRGITLSFIQKVENGTDEFNNATHTTQTIEIANCLIAQVTEPTDRVESAALERNVTMVRIHLPKADTRDVSNSTVDYRGETFRTIGRPVAFMTENTPTDWDRYLRAEAVNG